MISDYTAIVFLSAISMVIMSVGVHSNSFMPVKRKRRFHYLFLLLICANLSEWLGIHLNENIDSPISLHICAKFIEFIIAPIIPIAGVEAIGGDKNTKIMSIPVLANTALQIYSLFTKVVFRVDSNNMYHRGELYYVYIFLVTCSVIFLLIHCIQFGQRYQDNNVLFLSMILLFVVGIIVIQIFIEELRLDWTCVSISAIMFYIYYDLLVQQVDDMTTLLNRRSYNCKIENFHEHAAILFFDVDDFKSINDNYGHRFGDECLIKVSLEIRKVFEKYGNCYRFGGDEFCVIMTKNIQDVAMLMIEYLKNIEDIHREDIRFPSVSVGYVLFNPERETIAEAIERSDKIMYEEKERKKQARRLSRSV